MSDRGNVFCGAVRPPATAAPIAGAARAAGKPGEVTIVQAPRALFLRLPHSMAAPITRVTANGGEWKDFDPAQEVVRLHGKEREEPRQAAEKPALPNTRGLGTRWARLANLFCGHPAS